MSKINGIGSLNPYVDRLTISCIAEINPKGEVVNYRITPSIIRSRLKMSYDKVNDILKDHIVDSEYREYEKTLRIMSRLALVLRRNRIKTGSVEFNRSEIKPNYEASQGYQ